MDMNASDEFVSTYETDKPAMHAICVAMIFIFTLAIFAIYDWNVSRRQSMVMSKADHQRLRGALRLQPPGLRDGE